MSGELHQMGVAEMARALRERKVSAVEAAQHQLARIRQYQDLGAFVALGALAYAVYIIIVTLTSGIQVPGYASLMVAILFLGGLQLLSLGVLGEYVGRILTETKGRPLYVVRETIGD